MVSTDAINISLGCAGLTGVGGPHSGSIPDTSIYFRKESKVKIISLTIDTALGLLDALGSSEDPIFWRGKEITPQGLDYYYNHDYSIKASSVRIVFYSNQHKKVKGSLYTMVVRRLTER